MDGAALAIEALGAIIRKKDEEIKQQQETIDSLNRRLDAFLQYLEVYEESLRRDGNDEYFNSRKDF